MGYRISMYRMDAVRVEGEDAVRRLGRALPSREDWRTRRPYGEDIDGVTLHLEDFGFTFDSGDDWLEINGWCGEKQPWDWSEILSAIAEASPKTDATWIVIGEDDYIWAEVFEDGKVTSEDVEVVVAGRGTK